VNVNFHFRIYVEPYIDGLTIALHDLEAEKYCTQAISWWQLEQAVDPIELVRVTIDLVISRYFRPSPTEEQT